MNSSPFTESEVAVAEGVAGLPSTPWQEYSAPGKVFLLGEYAVLAGLPAVVAAVGPRFRMTAEPGRARSYYESDFHPQSPAGRLLGWAEQVGVSESTLESLRYEGSVAPGFGGSTAEFILLYRALAEAEGWDQDWRTVWKLYRELMSTTSGATPSGADLVAQWNGGIVLFQLGTEFRCERLQPGFENGILVFCAASQPGRKVATHSHLAGASLHSPESLRKIALALDEPLEAGIEAIRQGDLASFGLALSAYGDALRSLGLECEETRRDREALGRIEGVAGCKGAGAMQSDALVVVLRPEVLKDQALREEIIHFAESRGLELVADGLSPATGVARGHA